MNSLAHVSPRILSAGWGKMDVELIGKGKDFKIWPGGGRTWNWDETGTNHSDGIQVADVMELVEHRCETIILTRGIFSRLKVAPETMAYLQAKGIEAIVTDTKRGVEIYNENVERDIRVGGLFHSTC